MRTLRFTAVGSFLLAPTLHVWYGKLSSWVPGTSTASVFKRMALDQFAFAPLFIPTFMSCVLVLEGKASEIPERLRASWAGAVQANWGLWIPAQLLNFKLIPLTYQVRFRAGGG